MAPGRGTKAAASHRNSSQLADILNPVLGIRDQQRRAGLVPVDHAKANKEAIKQQSRSNRERKMFGEPATPDTLRRPATGSSAGSSRRGPSFGAPAGPPASDGHYRIVEVSNRNYVRENAAEAAAVRPKTRQPAFDDGRQWLCKEEYGLVPQYLQTHKLNLAAQQAAQHAAAEAAQMPAGMRVLGEAERQEMLDALSRSKHDIEAQLLAMPFVLDTISQVHHKKKLEERLAEVEQALRIFSQRRVLVKSDDAA